MRGSFTPSVNQVLTMGSQSSLILFLSFDIVAFPYRLRKSECAEPWNNKCTLLSTDTSWFLWLSSALKNQKLPSSSTCCTDMGRTTIGVPLSECVQKKQVFALSVSSLI